MYVTGKDKEPVSCSFSISNDMLYAFGNSTFNSTLINSLPPKSTFQWADTTHMDAEEASAYLTIPNSWANPLSYYHGIISRDRVLPS